MNLDSHPFNQIFNFFKNTEGTDIQFSIYEYEPQTVFDKRSFIDIQSDELNEEWLLQQISNFNEAD